MARGDVFPGPGAGTSGVSLRFCAAPVGLVRNVLCRLPVAGGRARRGHAPSGLRELLLVKPRISLPFQD